MIKLTIDPDSKAETRTFDQATLIIGSASASHVDLPLDEESLHEEHVKIHEENGGYVVINTTNDPFVTLNGDSFGRSALREGDYLTIANTRILFDIVNITKDSEETSSDHDDFDGLFDEKGGASAFRG